MKDNIHQTEITDWVKLYTKDLYHWAFQKTGDRELSEDLVQETFLAAFESRASFKRESRPKTWLFAILKNKIASHYRKSLGRGITQAFPSEGIHSFFDAADRWKETAAPSPWQGEPENITDDPGFNRVFDSCVESLPSIMNACIRLKFLDEKKGEQICQELGISTTNYWQLIHRAKLLLRECLEKLWFKLS